MKRQIFPLIVVVLILAIIIPLIILSSKKNVSGTYQAADEESSKLRTIRQQAMTEYKANRFDKAIEYYNKALDLRPDNSEIHNDLGSVYHDYGVKVAGPIWPNWESDLSDMSEQDALEEAEFAISDTTSGYIVLKSKDDKIIDKVIELAKKSKCWTHYEAGIINILKGKTMELLLKAEEHFLQAISIKSNYATAYRNLGALYYRIGKRKSGRQMMEYALEINPGDEQLRTYLEQFEQY